MRVLHQIVLICCLAFCQVAISQSRGTPPSPMNPPPVPEFSWTNTCLGDTTCFINHTIRGYTYTWTITQIGFHPHPVTDTIFKTNDTNFCYKFATAGTYTVNLEAYDNHYAILTKIITIDTVTKANFSLQRCDNIFVNTSLCATSFYWDFGDGTSSTQEIPIHQYADTGHYNVTLIAYNGSKSDTLTQQFYITAEGWPDPSFTYVITNDTVVNFHATTTMHSLGIGFDWSFGVPGAFGNGRDTMYVYKDSTAMYAVTLVVINQCGPIAKQDTISIRKYQPDVNFTEDNLVISPVPVMRSDNLNAFYLAYSKEDYKLDIYDPLGRIVYEARFAFETGINAFIINTSDLSDEMYTMVLRAGNTYVRKKFFVMNE
jgi:PKD repeat protein